MEMGLYFILSVQVTTFHSQDIISVMSANAQYLFYKTTLRIKARLIISFELINRDYL